MNAYAAVALFYGIVGLALFAGFFLLVTVRAYQRLRHLLATAPDLSAIGASLVACMLASLFFMATASIDWVEYVLAGLMASYVSVLALGGQAPGMATGASTPARGDGRFVLGGRVR